MVLIYVDDLLICGNNLAHINNLKTMLTQVFHMKDSYSLRYFLGLEVDRSAAGLFLSQKKYTTDILTEYNMLNSKPLLLPLDAHLKLTPEKGNPIPDPSLYQRLLGKLINLTITRVI